MDDKYWEALAERWEALREKGLVYWAKGMTDYDGLTFVNDSLVEVSCGETYGSKFDPDLCRPNLRDPATVGVLLSQWREACGDPGAHAVPPTEDANFRKIFDIPEGWIAYSGHSESSAQTEPEAIIAALEALEER